MSIRKYYFKRIIHKTTNLGVHFEECSNCIFVSCATISYFALIEVNS